MFDSDFLHEGPVLGPVVLGELLDSAGAAPEDFFPSQKLGAVEGRVFLGAVDGKWGLGEVGFWVRWVCFFCVAGGVGGGGDGGGVLILRGFGRF